MKPHRDPHIQQVYQPQTGGLGWVPVFCIRYLTDAMDRSRPLRLADAQNGQLCVSPPFNLEVGQSCRLLFYCNDPLFNIWVDAEVCIPPPPFADWAAKRGLQLLGQGRFVLEDYLEAVAGSLHRFFQGFEQYQMFSREDCRLMATMAGTRELQKSEILYQTGQYTADQKDLYFMTGGAVKVFKHDPANPRDNIAAINVGQMIGEVSMVIDQPHTASIAALTHAWLIQFSRSGIHQLENSQAALFIKLFKLIAQTLVRRLVHTTTRWKQDEEEGPATGPAPV
ncbi:MAG: hypothetical protein HJJLKODD_00297 [Phycisphaerae bacterium]|nr:hypothetical protein [Phycisphaerae bacterium]